MEIKFENELQVKIADLIWDADSMEDVGNIIAFFGHDGLVVYHMLIAHYFDESDEVNSAGQVVEEIFKKNI